MLISKGDFDFRSLIGTDSARNIVTNHLLHFLALDRSDPKKFQVLQLIAALLDWSDGMYSPFGPLTLDFGSMSS